MRRRTLLAIALSWAVGAPSLAAGEPLRAERFMIAAANPHAVRAGYEVLKAGGNAVDAMGAVAPCHFVNRNGPTDLERGTAAERFAAALEARGHEIQLRPLVCELHASSWPGTVSMARPIRGARQGRAANEARGQT